jgi:uncharacterized RDD family membrane protein YckC
MIRDPLAQQSVTPEAVLLSRDVAGLGSRMIAIIIDGLIQGAALFAFAAAFFAVVGHVTTPELVIYLVGIFVVTWGYFPIFEGLWGGRTPGKRAQSLRVVQTDGQPVGWASVIVRNLVRIVDLLPGFYAVGSISILLTKRSQRLGDLAAGTMVVREPKVRAPVPLRLQGSESDEPLGDGTLDATGLSEQEYELVRSFLERRTTFAPDARTALAAQLASQFRSRVAARGFSTDEGFLEEVAQAYRSRFRR